MAEELTSYDADLELLRTAAVTAGIIASSYFRRDLKTWTKENSSPVSEADIVLDGRQSRPVVREGAPTIRMERPRDHHRQRVSGGARRHRQSAGLIRHGVLARHCPVCRARLAGRA